MDDEEIPWDFNLPEAIAQIEEAAKLAGSIDDTAAAFDQQGKFKNRALSRQLAVDARAKTTARLDHITAKVLQV